MNRIDKKFKELKNKNKKAFMPYICYGYPDIKTSVRLTIELSKKYADIIEIGFPFSDPLADGSTIQKASQLALKNKITLVKFFNSVKQIRKNTDIPILAMTYFNPVFKYGEKKFIESSISAGIDGVIIPDLPYEESNGFIKLIKNKNFNLIMFVSPITSTKRAEKLLSVAEGFIYYVSVAGVTGARKKLPLYLESQIKKLKKISNKNICVGFGISQPLHIKKISNVVDGVIVGSALLNRMHKNIDNKDKAIGEVLKLAYQLNNATYINKK